MPDALLRALDIEIGRKMEGLLAGDYRSTVLGAGTELAQVRPYLPGDDVRRIDWNVTARTGEPHVRVHLAERVLVTWLVLDTSPSMDFGTADRRKADVAEGVALAIGHVATRRGQPARRRRPSAASTRTLPPRQGRVGLIGLLRALRDRGRAEARLGVARRRAAPRRVRRAAARARRRRLRLPRARSTWRKQLLRLAASHDVLAVEIRDPREQELADAGELWLVDPETGQQLRVDTRDAGLRARFAAAAAEERTRSRAHAQRRRRPARRALDRGRLAAAARRSTSGRRRRR